MIEDISELQEIVTEDEPEAAPDNSALTYSKWAFEAAVVIVDLITGYTIWQLTFWYYGLLWVLAGAVFFFLHLHNWERTGNNEKQVRISISGMVASVVAIVLMGVLSGSLWIMSFRSVWSEVGIVAASVLLFSFHAVQIARYFFLDDDFVIDRTVAKAKAQARKKVQIIKAGGEVVKAAKDAQNERQAQYKKHGDRGAVDAAIAKVEGKKQQQNMKPAQQFAAETQQVKPSDPTNPPR